MFVSVFFGKALIEEEHAEARLIYFAIIELFFFWLVIQWNYNLFSEPSRSLKLTLLSELILVKPQNKLSTSFSKFGQP